MTTRHVTLCAVLLLVCVSTAAQTTPSGRVLLPVVATNVAGAFGSQWMTDLVVFNNSANRADIAYALKTTRSVIHWDPNAPATFVATTGSKKIGRAQSELQS